MTRASAILATCIATLLASATARAHIDDPLPLDLAGQFVVPLRWHNVARIEGAWVSGRTPESDHRFRLAPGEAVVLRLPASSQARLATERWDTDGIEVAVGQGDGLFRRRDWLLAEDGSHLLSLPSGSETWLRLARAAKATNALEFSLYAARREPPADAAPYRHLWSLGDGAVNLRLANNAGGETWWPIGAGQPRDIEFDGPQRFLLELRLHYADTETEAKQLLEPRIDLDGHPLARPLWPTSAELLQTVIVDGKSVVAARRQRFVFETPAGRHHLRLDLPSAAFGRLLSLDTPDYLLPTINEPALSAAAARTRREAISTLSSVNASITAAIRALAQSPAEPTDVAEAAMRLALDSRYRDGGLVAAGAMRRIAGDLPDAEAPRRAADDMRNHYTTVHSLQPETWPADAPRRHLLLVANPPPLDDAGRGRVLPEQFLPGTTASLDSASFIALGNQPLEYLLPERAGHGRLRVAVAGSVPTRLLLQLDTRPPEILYFEPANNGTAMPSALEAVLVAQQQHDGEPGIASGAFARWQAPAPVTKAATIELDLPADIARIRLSQVDAGQTTPPTVALGLRLAQTETWTETAWHAAVAEFGQPKLAARWQAVLLAAPSANPDQALMLPEYRWQALARAIRADATQFTAGLAPAPIFDSETPPVVLAAANALLTAGQPLAALEHLTGVPGLAAHEKRIDILEALGENFLAEQLLKQLTLAEPADMAQRARQRLAARYRENDDAGAMRRLYAAALLRQPDDKADANALAAALLDDGEADLALQLLLTQSTPPAELLASAAYAAHWWATAANAAATLTEPRRAYWRGWLALAEGSAAQAEAAWEKAGDEGVALIAHRRAGAAIAARLGARPTADAIADWAAWRAAHPGPTRWVPASALIVDATGGARLLGIDRHLGINMARSEPGRLLRLHVVGPQRLRLEIRPVHAGDSQLLEGWVDIRSDNQRWVEPILANSPAPGLSWAGHTERAGRAIMHELDVPAGNHEFAIDGGGIPLLVRVARRQPVRELGWLPAIDDDSLVAPTTGPATTPAGAWGDACRSCVSIVSRGDTAVVRHFRLTDTGHDWAAARPLPNLPPTLSFDPVAAAFTANPAEEHWQDVLSASAPADLAAARRRLAELLWLAEHRDEWYGPALAAAETLAANWPTLPDRGALLERLHRRANWQPVELVAASAGQRSVVIDRWQPESPSLRTRQALLAPLAADEYLLTGDGALRVAFDNPRASISQVELTTEEVAGQLPLPLTVEWQVDDQPIQHLTLTTAQTHLSRRLDLPAGRHGLRLTIVSPVSNQWLRVSFAEGVRPFAETVERFYHLATTEHPLRADIAGPVWLRIDEWRNDPPGPRTESLYQFVANEWLALTLGPRPGEAEGMFRIHVLGETLARPPTPQRETEIVAVPVPPVPVALPAPVEATLVRLRDDIPMADQDPGTRSLGLRYARQLGPEQDAPSIDRYWELSTSWRRHDEFAHSNRLVEGLLRLRTDGAPSLGIRLSGSDNLQPFPANLDWRAAFFTQRPRDLPGVDGQAWGVNTEIGLSQTRTISPRSTHTPRLAMFVRQQHLNGDPTTSDLGNIDADVFSRYRENHGHGWSATDTWVFRPWLDSVAHAAVEAVGNPFNACRAVDHVSARLGWQQLIGASVAEVTYSHSRYLVDADRSTALTRRRIGVQLGYEQWAAHERRHQFGLHVTWDVDRHDWGLGMFWVVHEGNGRAYGDFRTTEVPFADLRNRHRPAEDVNLLEFNGHE